MDLQRVELGNFRQEIDKLIADAVTEGLATIEGVETLSR